MAYNILLETALKKYRAISKEDRYGLRISKTQKRG